MYVRVGFVQMKLITKTKLKELRWEPNVFFFFLFLSLALALAFVL